MDELVPHLQSVEFAKLLEAAGVPHAFITMEGAGHGFHSKELEGRVRDFLSVHLSGKDAEISAAPISGGR
jgi:acetyl esterase/lipase